MTNLRRRTPRIALIILSALLVIGTIAPTGSVAAAAPDDNLAAIVAQAVRPVMKQYGIPGMAVGVSVNGRDHTFYYGVASKDTGKHVDASTLFEIGSITKTFTASLATYAQITGKLSLSDTVGVEFSALRGTGIDHVGLINLGTHTAGSFPLQFPDDVVTDQDALTYYRNWKPAHAPGTYRLYSNPGIMLLGVITAQRMGADFSTLLPRELFAPLGLHHTFLTVPPEQLSHYAQGYTGADKPKRMSPGPLAAEAYGVRSTASDMLHFLDVNMNKPHRDSALERAIVETHTGYYRLGAMTQDLVWEQYRYPAALSDVVKGNSNDVVFAENPVVKIEPPSPPESDVLINKTGSTGGFGAYVAFVPQKKLAVVLLANKTYPGEARVKAAYSILTHLERMNAKQ